MNPDNPYYRMPPPFNHAGEDYVDLGLGAVIGDESELGSRITSYNVCYTKLLRVEPGNAC